MVIDNALRPLARSEPTILQRQQLLEIPSPCPFAPPSRHPTHTAVATTVVRSGARPAHWMGDITPAGLLTHSSDALLRLPVRCLEFPPNKRSVAYGSRLAAYSCGGSHGLWIVKSSTVFPLASVPSALARHGTGMHGLKNQIDGMRVNSNCPYPVAAWPEKLSRRVKSEPREIRGSGRDRRAWVAPASR